MGAKEGDSYFKNGQRLSMSSGKDQKALNNDKMREMELQIYSHLRSDLKRKCSLFISL